MAKLGSEKKPVRFRVQTEARLQEIATLCDRNGWIFVGGYEPDEPEDIREVEYMLNPKAFASQPRMGNAENITFVHDTPKVGRNDACPCGSGKKYKKCCMTRKNGTTICYTGAPTAAPGEQFVGPNNNEYGQLSNYLFIIQ